MDLLQSLYSAFKSMPMSPSIRNLILVTARFKPLPKASMQSLPNELLLEIFSFLELKPYIICHAVCNKWRRLLPSTQMDPIRSRLLDLYRGILDTQDFEKTLEWTDQHLQPFDREEYISCLRTQYPAIPDEFRMWILEWPARVVIHCTWPGLPYTCCRTRSSVARRHGVNWIAYRSFSPQLSSLMYKHRTPSQTFIPGLFIWSNATETDSTDWLIFGQDEPDLFGRVYWVNSCYHCPGSIPYYPPRQEIDDHDEEEDANSANESHGEDYVLFFDDWIAYLEYLWSRNAYWIPRPSKIHHRPDLLINQTVCYEFARPEDDTLPAPRWDPASVYR